MTVLKRPRNQEFLRKTLQISKNKCHSLPLFSFLLSLWVIIIIIIIIIIISIFMHGDSII